MKCPKCGYIGFEPAERCRNCGYDFSLATEPPAAPDLSLAKDEATGPVVDLPLGPHGGGALPAGREFSETPQRVPSPVTAPRQDLPLFAPGHESDDDRPLIAPSATPRPPLAVRRTPPPATRQHSRSGFHPPAVELRLNAPPETRETPEPPTYRAEGAPAATAGQRLAAAAIDLLILGALDAGVLYFTLRLCRLAAIEVFILPVAPLLLFFLILNGGYLLAFTTAGGQTIGKMAVGIKVVTADAGPLTLGQAAVRAIGCILCVVPAGLGFVPFLLVPSRRALHDRLAGTWVVKASTP